MSSHCPKVRASRVLWLEDAAGARVQSACHVEISRRSFFAEPPRGAAMCPPAGSPAALRRGRRSPARSNGHKATAARIDATSHERLTAPVLYELCADAKTSVTREWFSVSDVVHRTWLVVWFFYRSLLVEPRSLFTFTHRWHRVWYGPLGGLALTLCLPWLPFAYFALGLGTRAIKAVRTMLPGGATLDWQMAGPGRVFFLPPETLLASLIWDLYATLSAYCGSYLQYGTCTEAIEHTWYDTLTTKEFWCEHLDIGCAHRPRQLARWDGARLHELGPGVARGMGDVVVKISDSYLGIGDRVIERTDGLSAADVESRLRADAEYRGKRGVVSELVLPSATLPVASPGHANRVHSLDILTMRMRGGQAPPPTHHPPPTRSPAELVRVTQVRVLSVLLWTDCSTWSSHSATAGYLVDAEGERVVAPASWYAAYFAKLARQSRSPLIGAKLPGVREACRAAVASHESIALPWMTTVGWDAMLTDDGPIFFEGNVAAFRAPRRFFLSAPLLRAFMGECRGEGAPVAL